MSLVCNLYFIAAKGHFHIGITHIPGSSNTIADSLYLCAGISRFCTRVHHNPQLTSHLPTPTLRWQQIPDALTQQLSFHITLVRLRLYILSPHHPPGAATYHMWLRLRWYQQTPHFPLMEDFLAKSQIPLHTTDY